MLLNIKLLRESISGVYALKSHYVEKVLGHFGYSDYKTSPNPYDLVFY